MGILTLHSSYCELRICKISNYLCILSFCVWEKISANKVSSFRSYDILILTRLHFVWSQKQTPGEVTVDSLTILPLGPHLVVVNDPIVKLD